MVLKEAFEYISIIKRLFNEAELLMTRPENVFRTTETSLLSEVDFQLEDKTKDVTNETYRAGSLADVQMMLMEDMIRLQRSISEAKMRCEIDIDEEMASNKIRRAMIRSITELLDREDIKNERYGTAYRFNMDGSQVSYQYRICVDNKVDIDRSFIRDRMKKLVKEADEVSAKIDRALVTTEVDFEPWVDYKGLAIRDVYDMHFTL